ncbi:MAG: glycogen-binding domain-containing protein [Planctomycetota bacterium]
MTFTYQPKKQAEAVYLAGSFNNWKPTAHKMDGPDQQGRYTTRLKVKKGRYEYKFVLDGQSWQIDPENLLQTGPYQNSVFYVGAEPRPSGRRRNPENIGRGGGFTSVARSFHASIDAIPG